MEKVAANRETVFKRVRFSVPNYSIYLNLLLRKWQCFMPLSKNSNKKKYDRFQKIYIYICKHNLGLENVALEDI